MCFPCIFGRNHGIVFHPPPLLNIEHVGGGEYNMNHRSISILCDHPTNKSTLLIQGNI
jgi:hypothetical protein